MNIVASGEFWLPETPDETVRGAFRADAGEQPEVVLDRALVGDPRVSRTDGGGLMYAQGAAGRLRVLGFESHTWVAGPLAQLQTVKMPEINT